MLQWRPSLIDELAEQYRVILIDNRGSGRSGSSWKFYSMKTFSRDIRNILNHLGTEKVNLLGHSMGGSICQRFTITYPERVKKMVLIASDIGGFKRKFPTIKTVGMLIRGLKTNVHALLKHAFYLRSNESNNGIETRKALDSIDKVIRYYPISKRDHRKQLYAAFFFNTLKKVKEIQKETLLLAGECDKIVLSENSVRLAQKLPNATLSIIPNSGHFIDLQSILPDLFKFLG